MKGKIVNENPEWRSLEKLLTSPDSPIYDKEVTK